MEEKQMSREGRSFVYIGSWKDDGTKAGGIHLYELDKNSGELIHREDYCPQLAVGSFCVTQDKRFLYAVDEQKQSGGVSWVGGSIYAFAICREDGRLTPIDSISSGGVFPNDIAVDNTERYLTVSNYGSEDYVIKTVKNKNGTYELEKIYEEAGVVTVSIKENGCFDRLCDLYCHTDEPSRAFELFQSSPHPHSVNTAPLAPFLLAADRGCDELVMYRLDEENGFMERVCRYRTPVGSGPRTSVFHQKLPYFYVTSELLPYVTSYSYSPLSGEIKEIMQLPTVPPEKVPENLEHFFDKPHPSDIRIHPNGKFLYVATRGEHSLAVFAVEEDGGLSFLQSVGSGGIHPWNLAIDESGAFLTVCNQESKNAVVFRVGGDGKLVETGHIAERINRPAAVLTVSFEP